MKKIDSLRGFDKHLHKLLEAHPEAALEHAKLFSELPNDPRISSVVRAAKALRCHVLLIPDEKLNRLATA